MFKVIKKPLLYKRYLDDILVFTESEEEFYKMFDFMQKMSPSLKFTYVKCIQHLNFLDLKIQLNSKFEKIGKIAYNLFQKPENKHLYLNPHSDIKPSIKYGWITGENIRLLRISDCKRSFKNSMKLFINELISSGYSYENIKKYARYKYKHRCLVYHKKDQINNDKIQFIVTDADSLSGLFNKFVHKINVFYYRDFCLVEKNYNKLINELQRTSLKILSSISNDIPLPVTQ